MAKRQALMMALASKVVLMVISVFSVFILICGTISWLATIGQLAFDNGQDFLGGIVVGCIITASILIVGLMAALIQVFFYTCERVQDIKRANRR